MRTGRVPPTSPLTVRTPPPASRETRKPLIILLSGQLGNLGKANGSRIDLGQLRTGDENCEEETSGCMNCNVAWTPGAKYACDWMRFCMSEQFYESSWRFGYVYQPRKNLRIVEIDGLNDLLAVLDEFGTVDSRYGSVGVPAPLPELAGDGQALRRDPPDREGPVGDALLAA